MTQLGAELLRNTRLLPSPPPTPGTAGPGWTAASAISPSSSATAQGRRHRCSASDRRCAAPTIDHCAARASVGIRAPRDGRRRHPRRVAVAGPALDRWTRASRSPSRFALPPPTCFAELAGISIVSLPSILLGIERVSLGVTRWRRRRRRAPRHFCRISRDRTPTGRACCRASRPRLRQRRRAAGQVALHRSSPSTARHRDVRLSSSPRSATRTAGRTARERRHLTGLVDALTTPTTPVRSPSAPT